MMDWQIGDLAQSLLHRWIDEHTLEEVGGPPLGWVGKVTGVRIDEVGDLMLLFDEYGDPRGYIARAFRKIRPDEHEACEPEFVTLIKKTRQPNRVSA
jgi:hypothetical protein